MVGRYQLLVCKMNPIDLIVDVGMWNCTKKGNGNTLFFCTDKMLVGSLLSEEVFIQSDVIVRIDLLITG